MYVSPILILLHVLVQVLLHAPLELRHFRLQLVAWSLTAVTCLRPLPPCPRLQLFSLAGEFVRTIGKYGEAAGQFIEPVGVAVSAGLLHVGERDRVQVLTLDGVPQAMLSLSGHLQVSCYPYQDTTRVRAHARVLLQFRAWVWVRATELRARARARARA